MKTIQEKIETKEELESKGFTLWEGEMEYEKAKEFCKNYACGRDFVIQPAAVIRYDVYFKDEEYAKIRKEEGNKK